MKNKKDGRTVGKWFQIRSDRWKNETTTGTRTQSAPI